MDFKLMSFALLTVLLSIIGNIRAEDNPFASDSYDNNRAEADAAEVPFESQWGQYGPNSGAFGGSTESDPFASSAPTNSDRSEDADFSNDVK